MQKLPISLVIIALNEEKNIERCILSAPFVDDVVVVDSFSSDQTASIAAKSGARVIQEPWRGFGPQKSFAVGQAKNDWVISLDADEALSPELAADIMEMFNLLQPQTGYLIPRRSYHLGRWIRYGGWYPDFQLRLFNRRFSSWNHSDVHEKVKSLNEVKLHSPILHWVFDSLSDQVITNNRYSSLGADQLEKNRQKFRMDKLIFKPIIKFLETYFFKLGFLDGMAGFIIAVSAGYSVFLKWAKLWEKYK